MLFQDEINVPMGLKGPLDSIFLVVNNSIVHITELKISSLLAAPVERDTMCNSLSSNYLDENPFLSAF
ncbi:MAG: hypothetical protein H0X03_08405 [Nitrosopumilus sp.]|nr:hypothetical protein [Nitrosopumilus sp.]